MSKTIHQTVEFSASPHDVYEALMDEKIHTRFTASPAKISREVNGEYMAYDGYITGRNLELVPNKKIVQEWHAVDWEAGKTSKITFEFHNIPTGTRMEFTHSDVPEGSEEEFTQGWIDNYWEPMQKMFAEG